MLNPILAALLPFAGLATAQISFEAEGAMPDIISGYTYGAGCPSGSVETAYEAGHMFPLITLNEFFLDTTQEELRATECTLVLIMSNFTPGEKVAFHSVTVDGYSAFEEGSWIEWLGVEVSVNDEVKGVAGIEEEWGRGRDINWKFTNILHFDGDIPWNTCDIIPEQEVTLSLRFSAQSAVAFNENDSIPRGVLGLDLGDAGITYPLTIRMDTEIEEC